MKKLILAAVAIALIAVGIVRVELVAQPRPEADAKTNNNATRNAERAAKQKTMIDAARATYNLLLEHHSLGRQGPNEVYVWSNYLRTSEVRAADSKKQVASACKEHLDRMKRLHAGVAALSDVAAKGGEADKLHATQFYVAEAELLLLEANGNENVQLTPTPHDR
jgi:hypothetical protein